MTLRRTPQLMRRRVRNATAATAITPSTIVGAKLVLDLNGDRGVTIATGTVGGNPRLSAWADQGPRGNTVSQGTTVKQPTNVQNVLDGHASIRTDGSDDILERLNSFTGFASGDRPWTYTIAASRTGAASYVGGLYELTDNGTNGRCTQLFHENLDLTARWGSGGGNATDADYTDGITGMRLITVRYEPTAVALDVNNIQVATKTFANALPVTPDDLRVGGIFYDPYNGAYDIIRMVFVNPTPSAAEHAAMIAYLKSTYPSLPIA